MTEMTEKPKHQAGPSQVIPFYCPLSSKPILPALTPEQRALRQRNLALMLGGIVVFMVGMAFASVPLYRLFCQKTGFGGTPRLVDHGSTVVTDRDIMIQFTSSVSRDLPWKFVPLQHRMTLKIGENGLAFYQVTNEGDEPMVGMATYNVSPDKAAVYFNKINCFCFEEQTIRPGKPLDLPVQFFIDPQMIQDPNLRDVKVITLSYTFFRVR